MEAININQVAVVVVIIVAASFIFYITTLSLKGLKSRVFPYYPFDKFFPQSGSWSILYFLISVLFLGAIIYLLAKGGFYLNPA